MRGLADEAGDVVAVKVVFFDGLESEKIHEKHSVMSGPLPKRPDCLKCKADNFLTITLRKTKSSFIYYVTRTNYFRTEPISISCDRQPVTCSSVGTYQSLVTDNLSLALPLEPINPL